MISENARLVPPRLKRGVSITAILAILIVGAVGYFISRVLGHYLWYVVGAVFLVLSIYIYGLRSEG